jgi:glucose/arabinose dehydrogenase
MFSTPILRRSTLAGRARLRLDVLEDRTAPATLLAGFTETPLATGLSKPTAMEIAPDGRIFVAEQTGSVRVVKNNQLLPTPFITLPVDSSGERGVLGITFDPNFATNRFVYIYYTTSINGVHNRVSRFVANGDVAMPNTETAIVDLELLSGATNHNGGAIHFGLGGKLFIGVGDNADGSNSQNLNNRLGKILRVNADGTIPADNPTSFNGIPGTTIGVNRAIWAVGLRNPFTFAVQSGTGRLFINDVGQNTFEEINDGAGGANYGWPSAEGPSSNPAFTNPLFFYGHGAGNELGFAISGGAFYNTTVHSFPSEYVGDYFFADFANNWIRKFDPSTGAVTLFASNIATSPVDLKVDPSGNLLYLTHSGTGGGRLVAIQNATVPAQRQFIAALYRDFLGRSPGQSESDFWIGQFGSRGSSGVANAIGRSNESLGRMIDGVYAHILGRGADPGGRGFWINRLAAGQTLEQVIAAFTATSEFAARATALAHTGDSNQDFVRSLYQLLLQRSSGANEVAFWVGRVASQGRESVAQQILASAEFRAAAVNSFYGTGTPLPFLLKLLRRTSPAPAADVNAWVNSGLDVVTIETLFASSSEYFNNG